MMRNITKILLLFWIIQLRAMSDQYQTSSPLQRLFAYLESTQTFGAQVSELEVQKFFDAGIDPNSNVLILMPVHEWMRNYSGLPSSIIACCQREPALIRYIKEGEYEKACDHITQWTARVSDAQGRTPLYHAIRCQADEKWCIQMVTQLLEAGADPLTCGDKNATPPLCIAAFLHRSFLFSILCKYGASPDQKCLKGRDALSMSKISLECIPVEQRESIRLIRAQSSDTLETQEILRKLAEKQEVADTSENVTDSCKQMEMNRASTNDADSVHIQCVYSEHLQREIVFPWWLQYDENGN